METVFQALDCPALAIAKMNDPGLDKPISDDAKNLEKDKEEEDDELEDDQTYMDPR